MENEHIYKLLVFGTGCKSLDFKSIIDDRKAEIVAYIDNDASLQGQLMGEKKIISPGEISNFDYDYIIIASRKYNDISAQLEGLGVNKEKVIAPYLDYDEILHKHRLVAQKFLKKNTDFVSTNMNIQKSDENRLITVPNNEDYVRTSSLEKLSQVIYENNVLGNVAELGVYKGDFAKHINQCFYDRKFYLFDTFKGFDRADIEVEQEMEYSNAAMNDYQNTSVDIVLSKMKYPELCKIIPGYFPETALGLEEQFAFVSIDADLYNPTYAGLQYFYPLMVKHGCIFIHDFGNSRFRGVNAAVMRYCAENDISYFPLADICGTAVIIK